MEKCTSLTVVKPFLSRRFIEITGTMSCDKNLQTLTAHRTLCGRRPRERCVMRRHRPAALAHVSHPAGRLSFGYAGLNARKDRFGPEKYIYINDIKNHHECPRMCVRERVGIHVREKKRKMNQITGEAPTRCVAQRFLTKWSGNIGRPYAG